jgi:crotonobetainyl-CoA hydratase
VKVPTPPALVSRRNGVMVVTINRPEARNAINRETTAVIADALDEADEDSDIRAVVITGSGSVAFCAGADLKALARGEGTMPPGRESYGFAGIVTHPTSKPLIGAINGLALGGGLELVLSFDLVVAADTAVFGLPEVTRGRIAGAGGSFRLAAQVGPKRAMHMLLTGEPISSALAAEWGLVNVVTPGDLVLSRALELAERISANAPLAVAAAKRVALGKVHGRLQAEESQWAATQHEVAHIRSSLDAREGATAFAEKRQPRWTSR